MHTTVNGKLLRRLRENLGSREDFIFIARTKGEELSIKTLSRAEDTGRCSLDKLAAIARVLGKKVDDLLITRREKQAV